MEQKQPIVAHYCEPSLSKEANEILASITHIQNQLEQVKQRFNFATDDILIDSYIHELIALNKKYDYLIKIAKEMGLLAKGFSKTG